MQAKLIILNFQIGPSTKVDELKSMKDISCLIQITNTFSLHYIIDFKMTEKITFSFSYYIIKTQCLFFVNYILLFILDTFQITNMWIVASGLDSTTL